MNLNNLSVLDSSKSRSISPENFTGGKGQGGRATTGTVRTVRGTWAQAGKYLRLSRSKVGRPLSWL
jgi:hypothetical protein